MTKTLIDKNKYSENARLKKGELLEWLEGLFKSKGLTIRAWTTRDEQAYRQIKELIQKPGVTEEFVGKWTEEFAACNDYPMTGDLLREMLKEAGMGVSG